MTPTVFLAKVRDILTDNASHRMVGGQLSGPRLDAPRLALAPSANARVFKRPMFAKFARYAIALLVDASGSMCGGSAITKARALVDTLKQLVPAFVNCGVLLEVYSTNKRNKLIFSGTDISSAAINSMIDKYETELRSSNCRGNHTAHCLTEAVGFINRHAATHPGRIIVNITDGRPGCDDYTLYCKLPGCMPYGSTVNAPAMIAVNKLAAHLGVQSLCLGLLDNYGERLYAPKQYEYVAAAPRVYEHLLALLNRNITRG